MTIQELREKIDDASVSDEDFIKSMYEFVADDSNFTQADEKSIEELSTLAEHAQQKRPAAMETMRKQIELEHKDCCCGDNCNKNDPE